MKLPYDCSLRLVVPARLEEEVLDHLMSHPEWVSGFSVGHEEGFGSGATLTSAMEKVRGRSRRAVITALMEKQHVEPLLSGLAQAFPSPEVFWWISDVVQAGRLA